LKLGDLIVGVLKLEGLEDPAAAVELDAKLLLLAGALRLEDLEDPAAAVELVAELLLLAGALKLEDLEDRAAAVELAAELLLLLPDGDLAMPAVRCAALAAPVAAPSDLAEDAAVAVEGLFLGLFAGGRALAAELEAASGFAALLLRCCSWRCMDLLLGLLAGRDCVLQSLPYTDGSHIEFPAGLHGMYQQCGGRTSQHFAAVLQDRKMKQARIIRGKQS
jgi:hypothetical protein